MNKDSYPWLAAVGELLNHGKSRLMLLLARLSLPEAALAHSSAKNWAMPDLTTPPIVSSLRPILLVQLTWN